MPEILYMILLGILATAGMDAMALVQKRAFGIPLPDFCMVGRWVSHFPKGRFVHDSIGAAVPVTGECLIGWIVHYGVGVFFAAVFVTLAGAEWVAEPSLWPALAAGVISVVAPFFIMQPAMGAGIAASRTPAPLVARKRSLVSHLFFGISLFVAGVVLRPLMV